MIYKVKKVLRTSPFSEYRDGLELLQANVGVTHYYHTEQEIRDIVNMRTSYYARGKYDANGKPILEQIALTIDDSDMLKHLLSEVSLIAYDELQKLTHGLKDTYHFFAGGEIAKKDAEDENIYHAVVKDKFHKIPLNGWDNVHLFAVTEDAWYNISTNESHGFEIVVADGFLSTIRYTIWKKSYFSDDDEKVLDNAIVELFVRYVMWKWMSLYLPDTSQFETDYQTQLITFRNRVNAQSSAVERSYHLF